MADTDAFRRIPAEKQDRVITAAVQEFSDKGYQSASMNSVVREAGISKGSLFQYFRTKLDLFDSIVDLATGLAKKKLRSARETTHNVPFSTRLEAVVRAGFTFIDDHPHLSKIYFRILHTGSSPFGADRMKRLNGQSIEYLKRLLEEASLNGELNHNLDLTKTAFLIHGMMHHMLHAYYTEHVDMGLGLYRGSDQDIEEWITTIIELLSNGLKSPSSDKEFK